MDRRLAGVALFFAAGLAHAGTPSVKISGYTADSIRDKLVMACASNGGQVASDQYSVTCGIKQTGWRANMSSLLLGSGFMQDPMEYTKFTLISLSDGVFLSASRYVETKNDFGVVRHVDYDSAKNLAAVQRDLDSIAAAASDSLRPNGTPPAPARCEACQKITAP